jgi:hypothetical protein
MNTPAVPNTRPPLWTPNAAACWSLLFTPAFGAFLHALNAKALGREHEAKANRRWFRASLGYLGVILVSDFFPAIPDVLYVGVSIGLLFGWYFSVGSKQVDYVKDVLQSAYTRRSWTNPLLAGFAGWACFLGLAFVVELVADQMRG